MHHSALDECFNFDDCAAEVRAIQDLHIDGNSWNDIGYSFLIGGDGNVYEGRGWNVQGAHTQGFNDVGYGIDFMGNFIDHLPPDISMQAYDKV